MRNSGRNRRPNHGYGARVAITKLARFAPYVHGKGNIFVVIQDRKKIMQTVISGRGYAHGPRKEILPEWPTRGPTWMANWRLSRSMIITIDWVLPYQPHQISSLTISLFNQNRFILSMSDSKEVY